MPLRQYSGEFKQEVIEKMRAEGLSNCETARLYAVNEKQVRNWERIYLVDGPEGLYIERRGRASAASEVKKGLPAKLPKAVEEDLIAENQRLRAEIDYLKNLQALVLEDERRRRKKRR